MGALRRLLHSPDRLLLPLGLLVIVVAALLLMTRAGWFDSDHPLRPARYELLLADIYRGAPDAEPTTGMRFVASIYGTVTEAPPMRAPMVDPRVAHGTYSGQVHEDVARFVRAWPMVRLLDPGQRAEITTLDLRPEDFPTGARLILREGCLRVVKQGWVGERLVVPFGPTDLFRDPENYLAIGAFDGPAETRLRIGEPGGLIELYPLRDEQIEGVQALRDACGDAPIVVLRSAKRLPDCSEEYLAAEAERQRSRRAEWDSRAGEAKQCHQQAGQRQPGVPPPPCPPLEPPPPPPAEAVGGGVCRHPQAAVPDTPPVQPAHGSSTQP